MEREGRWRERDEAEIVGQFEKRQTCRKGEFFEISRLL